MRISRTTKIHFLLVGLVALGMAVPGWTQQDDPSSYHPFSSVKEQLEQWARENPALLDLQTVGQSAAGNPIFVLRIASAGAVKPDSRPAIFIGANMAGFHNAGTEAALDLIANLLNADKELLSEHTFYIAPVLNPDAHDGFFRTPKQRLRGNGTTWEGDAWKTTYPFDHDLDDLVQEDGPNDLNGDGLITRLRIPDPEGNMMPDEDDPRVLAKAESLEGQIGMYRTVSEGIDDDHDGRYNEDGPGGIEPNRNFAHGFEYDKPEAGPWASYAPESKAIMDFLLAHRNVAAAVVYGPANNLLATPKGFGGGGGTGSLKLEVPERWARFMGLDPDQKYTIDEIWEVAKDLPMVTQNNITKDQLVQFLGAGPATKPEDADIGYLEKIAEDYKERLKEAGLDNKRSGKQYGRGGITPWLYFQYGVFAFELDVWGIPKAEKKEEAKGDEKPLTVETMAEMSGEELVALGEEKISAFLKDIGAPPQFTAASLIERVESGQITPERIAQMAKRMGGGDKKEEKGGPNDLMVFIDEHAPDAYVEWTPVTLPDGTEAEVGGVDPFIEIAPPYELLAPALKVHTATVLDLVDKLARVEILDLKSTDLGGGIFRVEAVAGNRGFLATHSKMGARARTYLPLRLVVNLPKGASLVTGYPMATSERLEGTNGTFSAEWLIRLSEKQAQISVDLFSENAGNDHKSIQLGGRS